MPSCSYPVELVSQGQENQGLYDKSIFSPKANVHGKISSKGCLESGQGELDKSYGSGPLQMATKCSREGSANGKEAMQALASISSLDTTLPKGGNS